MSLKALRDFLSGLAEGVSPLSPPASPTTEPTLVTILHRDPQLFGLSQSRWTLAGVRQACPELATYSLSGIWRYLHRLGLSWKRGRTFLHSPDSAYDAKLAWVAEVLTEAAEYPGEIVALYQDELTVYRQPTLANAYARVGAHQPLARYSYQRNTPIRLAATLDPHRGRVVHSGCHRRLGVAQLVSFYQQICQAYPDAARIYLIQDNWPVHFHADLLAALQPQEQPFALPRSRDWRPVPRRSATEHWGHLALPIQLVPLPTYAPWTNPIEKLWRWLKQTIVHLHRLANDLETLQARMTTFLDALANGSDDLLRYTGLLVPD